MASNILLVDDVPQNLELLLEILLNQGYEVRCAISGSLALRSIASVPPDLILLDINMPNMDGYEVCRQLKACDGSKDIPIIFVSALGETLDKVKAFEVGGVDYVTKPFQIDEVLARIATHLKLKKTQSEVKRLNERLEQRVMERTAQLQEEIAERHRMQEQLIHRATHDELTNFLNLPGFLQVLEGVMGQFPVLSETYAVLTLVCEYFQRITNAFGHVSGDQLLLQMAHRLNEALPTHVVIARVDSDKFAILLEGLEADQTLAQQAILDLLQQIQAHLDLPFSLEQRNVFVRTKWGITLGQASYSKADHVLRDSDIASYQARSENLIVSKSGEKPSLAYCFFDARMHDQAMAWVQLEGSLRQAIEREEFVVHYQPIVSLTTGEIGGMEALIRWHHPGQGLIPPNHFIPAAESSGLIVPLGLIVLRQACEQMYQWQQHYPILQTLRVSVNLSVRQFAQPDLAECIQQTLAGAGLRPENLKLEITESAIMDNVESAALILEKLRSHNIQLAIDDFGTGYSSLSYLTQFPVDTLKIDRAFVNQLDQEPKHANIFQAIVTLAHTLGMDIVAEGIETKNQLNQLRTFGCQWGQGYFFSKPVDPISMAKLLAQPNWTHHWQNTHADMSNVLTH